jgi:hypothetical protein
MRIASHWIVAAGVAGLATVSATTVFAQERAPAPNYFAERLRAPRDAFELTVGAGYSQGTMSPAEGTGATDLTKAGGAVSVQAGYRFAPQFALNLYGEYNQFNPGNAVSSGATRGGVAGINGTFHMSPYQRLDPWARIGTGYRMLWVTGNPNAVDTLWHGFQLAKVDLGLDFRTDENIAIGPLVGVDVSHFYWRNPSGAAGDEEIVGKRFVPFVYAGIEGRFDLGGSRERRSGMKDFASR